MIEIIVLWQLGRRIAERARARDRRGGLYVLLLLAFWFSGELAGGVAAGAVMGVLGAMEEDYFPIAVYVSAIAGAAAGAWIAFAIASRGPVMPIAEFEDDPGRAIEPERI
jgi:predicted acylesterase/phospholipase RssA